MDHSMHHHHSDMGAGSAVGASGADPSTTMMPPMPPHDHSMMGHSMAFHFGLTETVLFNFWKTSDIGGLFVSCLIIVLSCVVYEGVKALRAARRAASEAAVVPGDVDRRKLRAVEIVIDAILHAIQLFLGYCLMLVFMTFNVWLCFAVIAGEVSAAILFRFVFPFQRPSLSHC